MFTWALPPPSFPSIALPIFGWPERDILKKLAISVAICSHSPPTPSFAVVAKVWIALQPLLAIAQGRLVLFLSTKGSLAIAKSCIIFSLTKLGASVLNFKKLAGAFVGKAP